MKRIAYFVKTHNALPPFHVSRFTFHEYGFSLLELIGVIAIIAILGAVISPTVINHLKAAERDAEVETLRALAHAIEIYLKDNHVWPPDLMTLTPNYMPLDTNQITVNDGGFTRYFFVHPDIGGITNATGLSVSELDDARFLLISNLRSDAAPTITNATEFDAWWETDETDTPDLKIYRGQVSDLYRLLTLEASGSRGAYQIDGTTTNWDCHSKPELAHNKYHLTGTRIALDEVSPYDTPEVQLTLAKETSYRYDPCHAAGSRWRSPPSANPECWSLWLTTASDVNASGTPCLTTWGSAELIQLGQPSLVFEPGVTGGSVSSIIDIESFTVSANVAAVHYVSRDITVGGTTFPAVDLFVGDVLLAVTGLAVLTSTNSLTVINDDVFVFRPDRFGDYRSGTFIYLLDTLAGPLVSITGISLVEQNTIVGGQTLQAGTFLYSRSGNSFKNKIYHFTANDVGLFTTSGTTTTLIDGSDIGMGATTGGGAAVAGVELIESDLTVGGTTLASGQILVTLDKNDNSVGNGTPISTSSQDIFILDVTTTGSGSTDASATLFLDGSDMNLNSGPEEIDGLTLAPTL